MTEGTDIERPEARCLFFAEEETGIESEVVREYHDMEVVVCESTRDVVVETDTSTAKLCREHAEHCVETGEWEFPQRQQKLPMTDGGVSQSGTEQSGLYEKYEVRKDGVVVEDCFVLEPESDPAAQHALATYANATDDEELSEDLDTWLQDLESVSLGEWLPVGTDWTSGRWNVLWARKTSDGWEFREGNVGANHVDGGTPGGVSTDE